MSEHALFEYKARLVSTRHVEDKGEFVHCIIKMQTTAQDGRFRRGAELEQEAGDLILFILNPGPHRRISESNISKVDEGRSDLGSTNDVSRVGKSEVYFFSD